MSPGCLSKTPVTHSLTQPRYVQIFCATVAFAGWSTAQSSPVQPPNVRATVQQARQEGPHAMFVQAGAKVMRHVPKNSKGDRKHTGSNTKAAALIRIEPRVEAHTHQHLAAETKKAHGKMSAKSAAADDGNMHGKVVQPLDAPQKAVEQADEQEAKSEEEELSDMVAAAPAAPQVKKQGKDVIKLARAQKELAEDAGVPFSETPVARKQVSEEEANDVDDDTRETFVIGVGVLAFAVIIIALCILATDHDDKMILISRPAARVTFPPPRGELAAVPEQEESAVQEFPAASAEGAQHVEAHEDVGQHEYAEGSSPQEHPPDAHQQQA